ncbi:MAG TPA: GntR family transcriptional regulator [Acidimicrobiales bacterium]|nr:GntR family transcriptional regulator [Acidimicrobiales bacterium]
MTHANLSIFERILQDILDGKMASGALTHENELAKLYGVSRTPIREALGALEYSGIIKRERGGIRITEPTPIEILQIYNVKAALEGEVGREAAINRTDIDLSILSTLLDASHEAYQQSRENIIQLNSQFHHAMREASHNRILVEMLDRLDINLSRFRETTMVHQGRLEQILVQHRKLLDAVSDGNSDEAMAIGQQHTMDARSIRLERFSVESSVPELDLATAHLTGLFDMQ